MAKDKAEPKKPESKASEQTPVNSKQEKFVELAEIRVSKALRQMAMIGNLSDKSRFDYTAGQTEQICTALQEALDQLKVRFENNDDKELSFKLG